MGFKLVLWRNGVLYTATCPSKTHDTPGDNLEPRDIQDTLMFT